MALVAHTVYHPIGESHGQILTFHWLRAKTVCCRPVLNQRVTQDPVSPSSKPLKTKSWSKLVEVGQMGLKNEP